MSSLPDHEAVLPETEAVEQQPKNDAQEEEEEEEENAVKIALNAIDHAKEEIISETEKSKPSRGRSASKATAKQKRPKIKASEASIDCPQDFKGSAANEQAPAESRQSINQRHAHQPSSQNVRSSIISVSNDVGVQPALNSSIIGPATADCDSGDETDDSIASRSHPKRKRKLPATSKKGKAAKKGPIKNRKIKEASHPRAIQDETEQPQVLEEIVRNGQLGLNEPPLSAKISAMEQPEEQKQDTDGSLKSPNAQRKTITRPLSGGFVKQAKEEIRVRQPDNAEEVSVVEIPVPEASPDIMETEEADQRHATPPAEVPPKQQTPKTVASPQSSDAENQPPSSRPSALRPPLILHSPLKSQTIKVPLAPSTPTASPSKRNILRLQTTLPWTSIDIEKIFQASPALDQENIYGFGKAQDALSSAEKKLSVEEWIQWKAQDGERKLRADCERLVGRFEDEGVRALKTLEGIICSD